MTDHYDDRYDGHDEYDDELGPVDDGYVDSDDAGQVQTAYVGDAQTLLKRAIDIVATAPTMPLSSSPITMIFQWAWRMKLFFGQFTCRGFFGFWIFFGMHSFIHGSSVVKNGCIGVS